MVCVGCHDGVHVGADVLTVKRWTRYGKDRLYVTSEDGQRVGWLDLLTDESTVDLPEFTDAFHRVVSAHREGQVDVHRVGAPQASDVALEEPTPDALPGPLAPAPPTPLRPAADPVPAAQSDW